MAESFPHLDSVTLRPYRPTDRDWLFRMQSDPEGCRLAGVIPRDQAAFDAHWQRVLADPDIIARVIQDGDRPVGSVSCFVVEDRRWVGYLIDRPHWGKGYATRGVRLLLEEVPLRPLGARVASHNQASLRVLEKCGFKVVGSRWSPATERFIACEEVQFLLE